MSLKLRLNLLISAALAVAMAAWAFYVVLSAREDVRAELRSTVTLAAHLLGSGHLGSGTAPEAGLDLDGLQRVRHLRIELRTTDGRLLATNRAAGADRPHSAPAWFEWLIAPGAEAPYELRQRVIAAGGAPAELVVRPDPSYEVEEVWSDTVRLAAVALLLFVAVNALVYWSVGRALRPVDRILEGLGRLERGDLHARLPRFRLPELARIGGAFNRMAEALNRSMTQNRSLAGQLIRVQEDERRGLARELHDELGQHLSAIQADAAAILSVEGTPEPTRESAQAILDVTRGLMDMVRGMLHRLRPEALDSLGLEEALHELVGTWRQRNPGVECRLRLTGRIDDLGEATNIAAYRVVQEGLTNVARHARAGRVEIEVERLAAPGAQWLEIRFQDDGVGIPEGQAPAGLGLTGMRERVEALGGSFSVDSPRDRGVALRVTLPATLQAGSLA